MANTLLLVLWCIAFSVCHGNYFLPDLHDTRDNRKSDQLDNEICQESATNEPTVKWDCNANLVGPSGQIILPTVEKYGIHFYNSNYRCRWSLSVNNNKAIMLSSLFFALEESPNGCEWDYLEIRDGSDNKSETTTVLCGYDPVTYISMTNSLFLYFYSDETYESNGFHLVYNEVPRMQADDTIVCNSSVRGEIENFGSIIDTEANGSIQSDTSCFYRIQAPEKYVVVLHPIQIENDSVLTIFDGKHTHGNPLMVIRNGEDAKLLTPNSTCLLHYKGRHFKGEKKLHITFAFLAKDVRSTTSPNLSPPLEFGGDTDCPCRGGTVCVKKEDIISCVEGEACTVNKCENGGTCIAFYNKEKCYCLPGTTGDICQAKDKDFHSLYFTETPGNEQISPNEHYIRTCKVNIKGSQFRWYHDNTLMTGAPELEKGILDIDNFAEDDEGEYTCVAISGTKHIEHYFKLLLKQACNLGMYARPADTSEEVGHKVLLKCYFPLAVSYTWYKDGRELKIEQSSRYKLLSDGYLQISDLLKTDIGSYTCEGRGESGCVSSFSAYLNVTGSDTYKKNCPCRGGTVCVKKEDIISCVEGEACKVNKCENGGTCIAFYTKEKCYCLPGTTGDICQAKDKDFKPLYFTETPENELISPNQHYIRTCKVNIKDSQFRWYHDKTLMTGEPELENGILDIDNFAEEDEGEYTCVAISGSMHIEHYFKLLLKQACDLGIYARPADTSEEVGHTVLLKCFFPLAVSYSWYKDGRELKIEQSSRYKLLSEGYLQISDLLKTDTGSYTCEGRGESGCVSSFSAYLNITESDTYKQICGISAYEDEASVKPSARISGGKDTESRIGPWHVMLINKRTGEVFCGGTLISKSWVVTSANCIQGYGYPFDGTNVALYLGSKTCGMYAVKRHVRNYVIHEHYDTPNPYDNDIAVIKMDKSVDFKKTGDIKPICIEPLGEINRQFLDPAEKNISSKTLIFGCGYIDTVNKVKATFLQVVEIPIVSRAECRTGTGKGVFTENMICGGSKVAKSGDICEGDSGGGWVMRLPRSNRWVLGGIASWGVGKYCDVGHYYSFYTHVGKYYDWLALKTNFLFDM